MVWPPAFVDSREWVGWQEGTDRPRQAEARFALTGDGESEVAAGLEYVALDSVAPGPKFGRFPPDQNPWKIDPMFR